MTYSISVADLEKNLGDIFSIWEENYPGVLEKKFEWIYLNNPAGSPLVLLLKHEESGKYVGIAAIFPRRFVIDGKSYTGGIAGDLIVNSNHRSAGPALMLQRKILSAAHEGYVDFLYGFPNKASEPILRRSGYIVFGERVRLVRMIKSGAYLSKLPFAKYWANLLAPFVDLIIKIVFAEKWYMGKNKFICEEVEDFDERFDLLWEKAN